MSFQRGMMNFYKYVGIPTGFACSGIMVNDLVEKPLKLRKIVTPLDYPLLAADILATSFVFGLLGVSIVAFGTVLSPVIIPCKIYNIIDEYNNEIKKKML